MTTRTIPQVLNELSHHYGHHPVEWVTTRTIPQVLNETACALTTPEERGEIKAGLARELRSLVGGTCPKCGDDPTFAMPSYLDGEPAGPPMACNLCGGAAAPAAARAAGYPRRGTSFYRLFHAGVIDAKVAARHGAPAALLLLVVNEAEAGDDYRGPVALTDRALADLCGLSPAQMRLNRHVLGESGWLGFRPDPDSDRGLYHVLLPTRHALLDDVEAEPVPAAAAA